MLDFFNKMFAVVNNDEEPIDDTKKIQIATCALFIEVANADDDFAKEEKDLIIKLMEDIFNLDNNETKELINLSEQQIKESVSLYEFTDTINKNFSSEEKYQILLNLWRLIFVDEKFHEYEDYLIRKIVNNLNLTHKDMIAAKMSVKEELKGQV